MKIIEGGAYRVPTPTESFPSDFTVRILGGLTALIDCEDRERVVSIIEFRRALEARIVVPDA